MGKEGLSVAPAGPGSPVHYKMKYFLKDEHESLIWQECGDLCTKRGVARSKAWKKKRKGERNKVRK